MSLVNDMLRDLDKRRQQSPNGEGASGAMTAAPQQLKTASNTRWLPLVGVTLVVLLAVGGMWLYDNPQLWQAKQQAPIPKVITPKQASVPPAPEPVAKVDVAPASVQIVQLDWLIQQPSLQFELTLNQSPAQRVLVSTPRNLQLNLGPVELSVELPDTPAGLIGSVQFVEEEGHLALQLTTLQDATFDVVGRSQANQYRLLVTIDPVIEATPQVAELAEVMPPPVSQPQPAPKATAKSATTSGTAAPAQQPIPVAPIRKVSRQTPQQRDQAMVSQARGLVNTRQVTQAKQLLIDFIVQQPEALASRTLLATLNIGTQQVAEAEQLIDAGLAIDGSHFGLRKLKARLLIQTGHLTEAIALLRSSQPTITEDTEYHQIRAAALQAAGEHQQAAEAYHSLLQTRASEPAWWIGLALSLEALQQPEQAKAAYRNVLEIPQVAPALTDFVSQRLARLGG
ncbi:MAG: tetratricopeptide repeat protein [Halopseudomonas sp.]